MAGLAYPERQLSPCPHCTRLTDHTLNGEVCCRFCMAADVATVLRNNGVDIPKQKVPPIEQADELDREAYAALFAEPTETK